MTRNVFPSFSLLFILFIFICSNNAQISLTTEYSATLSSTQVIHSTYSNSPVYGIGFCELKRAKPVSLYCHVCHQITEPVSGYIEVGDINKQGTPVYQFSVPLNPFFEEIIFLEDYLDYPISQQTADFLNGKWYITINALDIQKTVRGQLELNSNFYAYMANEYTFPPAFGPPHRGLTLGYYTEANPTRTMSFDICHNVDDATQTVLGRGVPGLPGEYFYDFRSTSTLTFHDLEYTLNEQAELYQGYQFTQINSRTNPAGAARGQLVRMNQVTQISLTARMDGSQSGSSSNARGCALIYFDCSTNTLEYLVYHSVTQPTSAQFRIGAPGELGPILFLLETAISPIYGSQIITQEQLYYIYSEQSYIQINAENFDKTTGAIRGQLTSQFDYYAFLSGSQVIPPVTTANIGCATINLKQFNYVLDFEVLHSITGALSVDIGYAAPGANGDMNNLGHLQYYDSSESTRSPLIGEMVIDDDDGVNLVQGNAYFQVVTDDYPLGEIRGQIMRINPCNPNPPPPNNATTEVSEPSFVAPPNSLIQLPIEYGNNSSSLHPNYLVLISLLCFVALICNRK